MSFKAKACALFISVCSCAFMAIGSPVESGTPSIALFPCLIDSGATATEGSFITERITLEILKLGIYKVIDRYEIGKTIGGDGGTVPDSCHTPACYFEMGEKCHAAFALWGKIERKNGSLFLILTTGDVGARQIKNTIACSHLGSALELAERIPALLAALLNRPMPPSRAASGAAAIDPQIAVPQAAQLPPGLSLRSVPSGAKVFINGKERGVTPYTIDSLTDGTCSIGLDLYGYNKFSEQFALKRGETKKILVHLHKLFGSLAIKSTPAHAKVVVSGVTRGTTPYACDTLRPGTYKLQLMLDRYGTFTKSFSIFSGKSDTVTATLFSLAYLDSVKHVKKKRNQLIRRITFGAGAAGFLGAGLYMNMKAQESLDNEKKSYAAYMQLNDNSSVEEFRSKYADYNDNKQKSDKLLSQRTVYSIIGSIFLAGFSVSLKF